MHLRYLVLLFIFAVPNEGRIVHNTYFKMDLLKSPHPAKTDKQPEKDPDYNQLIVNLQKSPHIRDENEFNSPQDGSETQPDDSRTESQLEPELIQLLRSLTNLNPEEVEYKLNELISCDELRKYIQGFIEKYRDENAGGLGEGIAAYEIPDWFDSEPISQQNGGKVKKSLLSVLDKMYNFKANGIIGVVLELLKSLISLLTGVSGLSFTSTISSLVTKIVPWFSKLFYCVMLNK